MPLIRNNARTANQISFAKKKLIREIELLIRKPTENVRQYKKTEKKN